MFGASNKDPTDVSAVFVAGVTLLGPVCTSLLLIAPCGSVGETISFALALGSGGKMGSPKMSPMISSIMLSSIGSTGGREGTGLLSLLLDMMNDGDVK